MTRPVDIVVTGFVKSDMLCEMSFEAPRRLKQEGVVRAIRYVTWDSPDLDAVVKPIAAMGGVEITRVPQPQAAGNFKQKGVVWQTANLDAALAQVPGDDTLVVKMRPDVVFDLDFLRRKIRDFDRLCLIDVAATAFGVRLRRAPFFRKIWLPWADANQPFFYEDAIFAGLKRDLAHLVTPDVGSRIGVMADLDVGSFAHVVRFGSIFLPRFPMFQRYFDNYHVFENDLPYRQRLMSVAVGDPFFWHLVVAHTWILHSSFHIDAGRPGDILFFPNNVNQNADWDDMSTLKNTSPYSSLDNWRALTRAGEGVYYAVERTFGRLVDDAWPHSVFTQRFTDIPFETLQGIAQNLTHYDAGVLREMEDAYYAKMNRHHRVHWTPKAQNAA